MVALPAPLGARGRTERSGKQRRRPSAMLSVAHGGMPPGSAGRAPAAAIRDRRGTAVLLPPSMGARGVEEAPPTVGGASFSLPGAWRVRDRLRAPLAPLGR